MNEDGYCICEICIKNCHAGHKTYLTKEFDEGFGPGFCDCGDEGSRGIRSCKMLKGTVPSELQKVYLSGEFSVKQAQREVVKFFF